MLHVSAPKRVKADKTSHGARDGSQDISVDGTATTGVESRGCGKEHSSLDNQQTSKEIWRPYGRTKEE